MKGIVVEIQNKTATVLMNEGIVVNVKNNNYHIGQEVSKMKKQLGKKKILAFASMAASLVFVFAITGYAYFTPYSYVSLDVNPSIEFSVNRFGRVLSATGVNDDGTAILNEMKLESLKNLSIEDAVGETINEISDAGYFDSETGGVVLAISSDDEKVADKLELSLEEVANDTLEENNHTAEVAVETVSAVKLAEARALGVTPGKLNLVKKLIQSSGNAEEINMEEWLHKSVKETMAKIKEYKVMNKEISQEKNEEKNQEKEQNAIEDSSTTQNQELNQEKEKNAVQEPKTPGTNPTKDNENKDNGNKDNGNKEDENKSDENKNNGSTTPGMVAPDNPKQGEDVEPGNNGNAGNTPPKGTGKNGN